MNDAVLLSKLLIIHHTKLSIIAITKLSQYFNSGGKNEKLGIQLSKWLWENSLCNNALVRKRSFCYHFALYLHLDLMSIKCILLKSIQLLHMKCQCFIQCFSMPTTLQIQILRRIIFIGVYVLFFNISYLPYSGDVW